MVIFMIVYKRLSCMLYNKVFVTIDLTNISIINKYIINKYIIDKNIINKYARVEFIL